MKLIEAGKSRVIPRLPDRKGQTTYSSVGVDRSVRERSRRGISGLIGRDASAYSLGAPVELPFGFVYPYGRHTYLDLQIEGVGTKVLLAELTGDYETVGIDAVAMTVNDVIRSGARPILLSDAIHISRSDPERIGSIIRGVRKGAKLSGALLCSGETGDVAEILHPSIRSGSPPFDLFVSALGVVEKERIIRGRISVGDVVIAMESSGIHSNGLTLARKVLLKRWGGEYEPEDRPPGLGRNVLKELLQPTRIYTAPLLDAASHSTIKAALHITGDGFFKFARLSEYQRRVTPSGVRIGFRFDAIFPIPSIFRIIEATAEESGRPISRQEMYRTFNMGFGFAVIVGREQEKAVLNSFNRWFPARRVGTVTKNPSIVLEGAGRDGESISLLPKA